MEYTPNVLRLFCDQLRYHALSCSGDPNIRTPNLDRLAAEGARFTTAVTNCPVCTPARAGVMTGMHCSATGVRFLGDLLPTDQRTVAHAFRSAGYRTSYVGKWHLASVQGAHGTNEGEDYWVHPLLRGGFEDWFGFEISNHFYVTRYSTGDRIWPPNVLEGYQTDVLTDLSLEYLARTAEGLEQPWFHVLSVEAPHHGRDDKGEVRHPAPPSYEAQFRPDDLVLRANVPEETEQKARAMLAQYYAQIANLDENVGRILDWLEQSRNAENTLVCFLSDHGEKGGSHGAFMKEHIWDEAVLVPMIVRLPVRVAAGQVVQDPFSLVDLFPTTAGLCGVPVPPQVQGVDWSNVLSGLDTTPPRTAAFVQWVGPARYGFGDYLWRGIRTRTATYAVGDRADRCFLYENVADPFQMQNLFGCIEARELQQEMHARLVREILCAGERVPGFVAMAMD